MGRKSKAKDRNYQTRTEWETEGGGFKRASNVPFKRLPFYCCAISFQPFEDPACTADGTVYDIVNIVPYVQKFKRHPVTGEPLSLKDVIKLTFHRNADGEFHCPVLNKVFTEHTHIVAVRPSGNVYCYEAIEELNAKPKYWKDLLTDEPFTRKDVIHIQDPLNLSGRTLEAFDHVKRDLKLVSDEELAEQQKDPMYGLQNLSGDAKRVLAALGTADGAAAFKAGGGGAKAAAERLLAEARVSTSGRSDAAAAGQPAAQAGSDPRLRAPERQPISATFKPGASTWNTDDPEQQPWLNKKPKNGKPAAPAAKPVDPSAGRQVPKPYMSSAKYIESALTTGAASRGFTSTTMGPATKNERVMVRIERCPKKKAYLRLHTSLGDLNLELHCDLAPRTCENFLVLAESGYYSDTMFHRSIKNFMIQGGDPTGTGTGGESIYGPTFRDELDSRLTHTGRGVLSMANSGKDTNGSQFYILYKSAHHLDFKHSVFGRVVGGFETLTAMEKVPTDDDDRPKQEIKITGATVFVNPYKEEEEEEARKAEEERKKAELEAGSRDEEDQGQWFSNPSAGHAKADAGTGVGKYLPAAAKQAAASVGVVGGDTKKRKAGYGNFDVW